MITADEYSQELFGDPTTKSLRERSKEFVSI